MRRHLIILFVIFVQFNDIVSGEVQSQPEPVSNEEISFINLLKAHYDQACIIVLCDIDVDENYMKYTIKNIYRGEELVSKISQNNVLIHKDKINPVLKSREAVCMFVNEINPTISEIVFTRDGEFYISDHMWIKPEELKSRSQMDKIFKDAIALEIDFMQKGSSKSESSSE